MSSNSKRTIYSGRQTLTLNQIVGIHDDIADIGLVIAQTDYLLRAPTILSPQIIERCISNRYFKVVRAPRGGYLAVNGLRYLEVARAVLDPSVCVEVEILRKPSVERLRAEAEVDLIEGLLSAIDDKRSLGDMLQSGRF